MLANMLLWPSVFFLSSIFFRCVEFQELPYDHEHESHTLRMTGQKDTKSPVASPLPGLNCQPLEFLLRKKNKLPIC